MREQFRPIAENIARATVRVGGSLLAGVGLFIVEQTAVSAEGQVSTPTAAAGPARFGSPTVGPTGTPIPDVLSQLRVQTESRIKELEKERDLARLKADADRLQMEIDRLHGIYTPTPTLTPTSTPTFTATPNVEATATRQAQQTAAKSETDSDLATRIAVKSIPPAPIAPNPAPVTRVVYVEKPKEENHAADFFKGLLIFTLGTAAGGVGTTAAYTYSMRARQRLLRVIQRFNPDSL